MNNNMIGNLRKLQFLLFLVTISLGVCHGQTSSDFARQPTLSDYSVGEKWIWKYRGVTSEGEVRSDGTDTREIIKVDGVLNITIGSDTIPVADIVKPEESSTPRYDWPLEVGKKWKYEKKWKSQDGTEGTQSQDVQVLSFKEETVEAGTFMAYTIEYKGNITNSRGYIAETDEVWLYAPEVKNFIKLTQTQKDFLYVEELIEYVNPE